MKLAMLLLFALGLTACQKPNLTQIGTEQPSTVVLQKTPGLEGCSLYKFKVEDFVNPIHIVRCPRKETISIDHQYTSGKAHVQNSTIIVEE